MTGSEKIDILYKVLDVFIVPLECHHPERSQDTVGLGILDIMNDMVCRRYEMSDGETSFNQHQRYDEVSVYTVEFFSFNCPGPRHDAQFLSPFVAVNLSIKTTQGRRKS